MIALVAPWDSIGFQIITVWIVLILAVCWIGGRHAKARERFHRDQARQRWREQRDAEIIPLRRNMPRDRRPAA